MEQELEILQGAVSAVVFQNYENGYAVLRLNVGGGQNDGCSREEQSTREK